MIERYNIKKAIDDWKLFLEKTRKQFLPRSLQKSIGNDMALGLVGVRRCGKTFSAIELTKNEKVFYFNFEDPIFIEDNSVSNIDELISVYTEYYGNPEFIIFDEIQNISGWERWLRKAVDMQKFKVIITGSSSKLLSSEISTSIAGRCLEQKIWPLSFREYLKFTEEDLNPIEYKLRDYTLFGGFPAVVLKKSKEEKIDILKQYINDIVLKDIIDRYKIRNKKHLDQIIVYYLTNISSNHSASAIKKAFGINIETVTNYTSYLEEAFFIFSISRYHNNLKEQQRDSKKVYTIDTGLRDVYARSSNADYGKLAENIVFIELKRRGKEIYYFKGKNRP